MILTCCCCVLPSRHPAAVSMNQGVILRVNLGQAPFAHAPSAPFLPVADSVYASRTDAPAAAKKRKVGMHIHTSKFWYIPQGEGAVLQWPAHTAAGYLQCFIHRRAGFIFWDPASSYHGTPLAYPREYPMLQGEASSATTQLFVLHGWAR